MRKKRSSWAEGLTSAELQLVKQHKLWKRDGSPFWWTRVNGKKTSLETQVLADAVAKVAKERHESWKEDNDMGARRKYSWGQACRQFEKDRKSSMKSWDGAEQKLRWWWPHLQHIQDLNLVTRKLISGIIEDGKLVNPDPSLQRNGDGRVRVNENEPAPCNTTANKYVRIVSSVLSHAEEVSEWGNRVPVFKNYAEPEGREDAPTPYEVLKLVERLLPHARDMVTYGCMTAHRRANVTGLEWSMIDWTKRAVSIRGLFTKSGKRIFVPLNSVAMAILEERRKLKEHPRYVFTWRGKKIKNVVTAAYKKRVKEAGLAETVVFHTTRHCWQTWMAEEGVLPEMRARLGGWKVVGMGAMDDYVHLNIEPLRELAEITAKKWNAAIELRRAELGTNIVVPNASQSIGAKCPNAWASS
jgi:integrase